MKRILPPLVTSLCFLGLASHGYAKPKGAPAAHVSEPAKSAPDAAKTDSPKPDAGKADGAKTDAPRAAPDAAAKKEAARRFDHGIKLYEDGDYTVALAEFERVYELVPDYRVLYNIGQVSIQLGHYARALVTLREYVARGGNELPADRAKSVQADIDLLTGRTASIVLQVEPEGVEVTIDGKVIGTTPIADPVVVDVGERRVELKRSGFVSQEQTLSLAGGDRYVDQVKLVPEAVASERPIGPAPIETLPPAKKAPTKTKPIVYAGYGLTSALAVGAVVSFALGASAAGDLKDLKSTRGVTQDELDDAKSKAHTRLLIADVLGAAAVATGAVTLYLHLSGSGKERARSAGDVWVGVGPRQVSLGMHPAWLQ